MCGHAPVQRSHCQNCGEPLTGPYCSRCGQHDVDYNQSFWHIVEDGLEGLLHFDGKFFRSARYIFTRPGFLTKEFVAGRRARYMHPVRLYIFASFLFFAISVLTTHHATPAEKAEIKAAVETDLKRAQDDVAGAAKESPEAAKALASIPAPGIHVTKPAADEGEKSWLDDPMQIRTGPKDKVNAAALGDEIMRLLPAMLFFCLPLLALVLKLVYFRLGRLYVEHLIFALNIQALAFLSFIVIDASKLLGVFAGKRAESAAGYILLLGMFYLIYRAFRTVYGQGRARTALKLGIVLAAYGLILIFGLVGVVLASAIVVQRSA